MKGRYHRCSGGLGKWQIGRFGDPGQAAQSLGTGLAAAGHADARAAAQAVMAHVHREFPSPPAATRVHPHLREVMRP